MGLGAVFGFTYSCPRPSKDACHTVGTQMGVEEAKGCWATLAALVTPLYQWSLLCTSGHVFATVVTPLQQWSLHTLVAGG